MNTLVKFGYQALLFAGIPEGLIQALSKAKIVEVKGYGKDQIFEQKDDVIEIQLITAEQENNDRPVLEALHEAEERVSKEINKRYQVEAELKKLKKQFNLEEDA